MRVRCGVCGRWFDPNDAFRTSEHLDHQLAAAKRADDASIPRKPTPRG